MGLKTSSKPLFAKPFGAAEETWDVARFGSTQGLTCEFCGTYHPPSKDKSRLFGNLLGRQIVFDCCGRFIDELYNELGTLFAEAHLNEFEENPLDSRFSNFRKHLFSVLHRVAKKASRLSSNTEKVIEKLGQIG